MALPETIFGLVAIGVAIVAAFIVYLVLSPKTTSHQQTHHLPDMRWYSDRPELADAVFMTFSVVLWIGSIVPQLMKNASAPNSAEIRSISPFFIVLPPVVIMTKLPGFRHILADAIHSNKNKWAVVTELSGLFAGLAAFIIWIFQYAVPLYNTGTDMVLSTSLLVLGTLYSVIGLAMFYWVYNIIHSVIPQHGEDDTNDGLEMVSLLSPISDDNSSKPTRTTFNPFENTTIQDNPFADLNDDDDDNDDDEYHSDSQKTTSFTAAFM
jgi:hypothetical protein